MVFYFLEICVTLICLFVLSHRVNGADTVTCQFTADDVFDDIWVDGVNKKASVTPQTGWGSIPVLKRITFDDSATVLAFQAQDNNSGCRQGGFACTCTSTKADSEWNMNEVDDRTKFKVFSANGGYGNPPTDGNGRSWFQVGYEDTQSQFTEALVGVLASADYGPGICGGPGDFKNWSFLYTVSSADAGGDPHFVGFGNHAFSWQGVCDLILLKTPKLSSSEPELSIHIRTKRIRQWSAIGAVAIQIGNEVMEVESNSGELRMNGKEISTIKSKFVSVTKTKRLKKVVVYTFNFGKKRKLEVEANVRTKMLYTSLKGDYPAETVGLLGSPHKPGMFARDGSDMIGTDVNSFVESWQIRNDDPKLFNKAESPQYPSRCCYSRECDNKQSNERRLKEVQTMNRETAIAACSAHLVTQLREFCIEDVLATGDIETATSSFYG